MSVIFSPFAIRCSYFKESESVPSPLTLLRSDTQEIMTFLNSF